jgi:rod shape-determining protein MreD
MKALMYVGLALLTLGLQITVVPNLAVWGVRPNLVLVTLLAVALRWRDTFVFVYAALLGVALDSFSHGVLGVYGISFFGVALAARVAGGAMYEDNILSGTMAVFGLSLLEGIVFTSVFRVLDREVPWWNWVLARVLPGSLYNALLAPFVFMGLMRLERWLRVQARER